MNLLRKVPAALRGVRNTPTTTRLHEWYAVNPVTGYVFCIAGLPLIALDRAAYTLVLARSPNDALEQAARLFTGPAHGASARK